MTVLLLLLLLIAIVASAAAIVGVVVARSKLRTFHKLGTCAGAKKRCAFFSSLILGLLLDPERPEMF